MGPENVALEGSEAIFRGAVDAGARFFAGYPISPANEILALAAKYSEANPDFHFVQSEDEIAALGHCIGAALAGLKAFTATAPPGLRLMQEFIGFARHIRCPLVIVNVQRGNASTGLPTQPAQQDIMSVRWGAGGDYETLAFYPNSVPECYEYTIHAFNAASESSSPVFLFSDANIAHLVEPISLSAPPIIPLPTVELGLRTRWITGLADLANYKSEIRSQQIVIRQAAQKYRAFEISSNRASGRLLISYGAISRTLYYFTDRFAFFRPIRIFPMLEEELHALADIYPSFIVVEANEGQYAELVERIIGRSVEKIAIYAQDMNRKELLERELSRFA